MVLANQTNKTVHVLRAIALGVLLLGATALTACGGGGSSADGAGIGTGPGADSGLAPTVPAQPFQVLFAGDNGKTGTKLFRTDGSAAGGVKLYKSDGSISAPSLPQKAESCGKPMARRFVPYMQGSDGTAVGTVQVMDLNPGSTNGVFYLMQ